MSHWETKYEEVLAEYKRLVVNTLHVDDYVKYNEILFSAHSCAIEGNSFSVDDTRALFEQGLAHIPQGKTLYEACEILDHFKAYEYMLSQLGKPLSEELIKEIQRLTVLHTLPYRVPNAVPGEYTDTDMAAGDTLFGDHNELIARIPLLVAQTNEAIAAKRAHPMIIAARFHCYFEYLHPFRDGNGRTGRLLANFILLNAGLPPVIIDASRKPYYIEALKYKKREGTTEMIEGFFWHTAITRMQQEISEKQSLTEGNKEFEY